MQKIKFLGIIRRSGVAKDSGNSYDMMTLSYIVVVNQGKFGGMTVEGIGYDAQEMSLEEGTYFEIKKANPKALSDMWIDVQVDLNNPSRSKIAGFSTEQPKAL